jgi:ABC-type phosphate transport system permease subunit
MGIHLPQTIAEAAVTGASLVLIYMSIALLIFLLNPAWREHLRPAVQISVEALAGASRRRRLA